MAQKLEEPDAILASGPTKTQTSSKTFRFKSETLRTLQEEAEERGVSVNALVSEVLTDYVEWERFARKRTFPALTSNSLRMMLEKLGEDSVAEIASERAKRFPETVLLHFQELSVQNYVRTVQLEFRHLDLANVQITRYNDLYHMIFLHELGRKWSIYLESIISNSLKDSFGISSKSTISDESLILTFEHSE